MAFSFEDYEQRTAASTTKTSNGSAVGFFKLGNNEAALVRINYGSVSDFMMTAYHQFDASQNYMKVECLAAKKGGGDCPLCRAVASGNNPVMSKAKTRIFVPMLAAYIDSTTQQPKPVVPVIWDAAANNKTDWAKELAMKLNYFSDLREHVFIIKRTGEGFDTKYSLDYVPMYDKEEFVPKDFSAFENFRIDKHSYWVKSYEEISTYLATGTFPAPVRTENGVQTTAQPTTAATGNYNTAVQPNSFVPPVTPNTVVPPAMANTNIPVQTQPVQPTFSTVPPATAANTSVPQFVF